MKRIKNNRWAGLMIWALFPLTIFSQGSPATDTVGTAKHELSLQQAVDFATKNNVQVKNALLEIKKQEETNREVTSAALP
ncbi:MAG: hypothetical protein EOO01_40560, partial [Chitinophagaceae bacterium]